jgi:hypothetical protein
MRSPTLFIFFLAGGATAAFAEQPTTEQIPKDEISGRVTLKETDDKKPDTPPSNEWVELASPTPAKHGTEFIVVGKEAGEMSRLRLDAVKGRTNVRRVKVFFDDGKTKTVQLDRALKVNGQKSAIVELGGPRLIDRVVITTETHTSGEYALYGSSSIAVKP